MNMKYYRLLLVLPVSLLIVACVPAQHCFVGSQITIPQADSTPPSVGIDFHMPDGSIVSRTLGDGLPTRITVPSNGQVTIIANTNDAQGVKDSRIYAATKSCSEDSATGIGSCSGPGLLGNPTASNAESNSVGSEGCTQRIATQNVSVTKTTVGTRSSSVSVEVSAEGVNFGRQVQRTTTYSLER